MLVSHLRSIIAAAELDFCVRNENRYFPSAMDTEVRFKTLCADIKRSVGLNLASESIQNGHDALDVNS